MHSQDVVERRKRHLRLLSVATQAVDNHGAKQKPRELAALLELVHPSSVVVELGCDQGGTLWAFKTIGAHVIGVTLQDGWFGSGAPLYAHGCPMVLGDTRDPYTLERLAFQLHAIDAQIDLLFIDADHRYEGVLADFNTYAPLVRPGGIVALHDICHHEPVDIGGGQTVEVGVERLWGELSEHFPQAWRIIHEPHTWGGIGLLTLT